LKGEFPVNRFDTYCREHRDRHLREYFELLRIPSIRALPQHKDDVGRAAQWVADRCRQAGLEHVQVLATGCHPVVSCSPGTW
jgi:acetylornithine deacetylase/succinyl-diaminopimelate desuccinylase-like protein